VASAFGHLKLGRGVVYPMHTQMQLLIDAAVVGAHRVFDQAGSGDGGLALTVNVNEYVLL
jgi:hypothetical protein